MEMSEPERIKVTIIQASFSKTPNGSCPTIKEQEIPFHPYYQCRWPPARVWNTGAGADNASLEFCKGFLHCIGPRAQLLSRFFGCEIWDLRCGNQIQEFSLVLKNS
jgi:hypothetical protein